MSGQDCALFPLTPPLSPWERGNREPLIAHRVRPGLFQRGNRSSLSPRERAGVRGRVIGSEPIDSLQATKISTEQPAFRCIAHAIRRASANFGRRG